MKRNILLLMMGIWIIFSCYSQDKTYYQINSNEIVDKVKNDIEKDNKILKNSKEVDFDTRQNQRATLASLAEEIVQSYINDPAVQVTVVSDEEYNQLLQKKKSLEEKPKILNLNEYTDTLNNLQNQIGNKETELDELKIQLAELQQKSSTLEANSALIEKLEQEKNAKAEKIRDTYLKTRNVGWDKINNSELEDAFKAIDDYTQYMFKNKMAEDPNIQDQIQYIQTVNTWYEYMEDLKKYYNGPFDAETAKALYSRELPRINNDPKLTILAQWKEALKGHNDADLKLCEIIDLIEKEGAITKFNKAELTNNINGMWEDLKNELRRKTRSDNAMDFYQYYNDLYNKILNFVNTMPSDSAVRIKCKEFRNKLGSNNKK